MPRSAAVVTYADFLANSDPAAVLAAIDGAPSRAILAETVKTLTGHSAPPTAYYNLFKSLEAIRDHKSYSASQAGKEYGNPTGTDDYASLTVPMQGGLTYPVLNTLAAAFADKGRDLFPKEANGNGNGSAPAAASGDAPSTPVTSTSTTSGPMNVDPILFDAVSALQERFKGDAVEGAPLTGRAFLEMLWNATPEEERNRRVNSIARAFVQDRESASRRTEIAKMVDSLSAALKEDGTVEPDFDIWTFIYNRALPLTAQSESYEQIKTNLKNAYRFDPDAATFRDWESVLKTSADAFFEMFGKDMGIAVEAILNKSATKRTRETLEGIMSGMTAAQKRFEEWETRTLTAAASAAPPAPVLERIAWEALSAPVQGLLPEQSFWEMLTADQQRSFLAQRSVTEVDGSYVLKAAAEAAAADEANRKLAQMAEDAQTKKSGK